MFWNLKEKILAGLLSCACVLASAGFGVARYDASAEVGGDNPSVTQGVAGTFAQGSQGDSIATLQNDKEARAFTTKFLKKQ
jgi:hypothetical protein